MIPARRLVLASLTAIAVLLALAPLASADRTFSLRYQTVDRADSVFVANTLMTCPAAAPARTCARAPTRATATATSTRSTSTRTPTARPSTRAARTSRFPRARPSSSPASTGAPTRRAGTGGSAAPNAAANNVMSFKTPGARRATRRSPPPSSTPTRSSASRYQGFADVTSLVQAGGAGHVLGRERAGRHRQRPLRRLGARRRLQGPGQVDPAGRRLRRPDLARRRHAPVGEHPARQLPDPGQRHGQREGRPRRLGGRQRHLQRDRDAQRLLADRRGEPGERTSSTPRSRAPARTSPTKNPNYVNQLGIDADQITANGFIANSATSHDARARHLAGHLRARRRDARQRHLPAVARRTRWRRRSPAPRSTAAVLTANPGTWTGSPAPTYTYQWRRCNAAGASCVDIAGATALDLHADDHGRRLDDPVVVTGTNPAGNASATSAQTAVVDRARPVRHRRRRRSPAPPRTGRSSRSARAPGTARRRSPTPARGSAATPRARAAWRSPARPARPTR